MNPQHSTLLSLLCSNGILSHQSAQISKNALSDCGKQVGQLMISVKLCKSLGQVFIAGTASFQELGDVERPPSPLCSPAHILTCALLPACQDLFAQESDLFLDEVVSWLAVVHSIQISTMSLSRELGVTRKSQGIWEQP